MIVDMADAMTSEHVLVKRAQRGQMEAFEALYRANVGRVFALCRRMCANPAMAEDLSQEAFVRAWQKLSSFRGDSAFSTWLHRLTVNVVLGHLRSKAGKMDVALDDASRATPEPATSMEPGVSLDLEAAIATLPDRARTVFVLHDVEGYRHREIAVMAHMAVGTSKAHLHRARKLLREVLGS